MQYNFTTHKVHPRIDKNVLIHRALRTMRSRNWTQVKSCDAVFYINLNMYLGTCTYSPCWRETLNGAPFSK